ncbi:MAG: putative zinc-binding metallopeptidase [Planctomycetota bacterium]
MSRLLGASASILLTLVLQVIAIEAVFFPPPLPFRLNNDVPIVWSTADDEVLSPRNYHGTRLDQREAASAMAAVQRSMRFYPQWILDQHLDEVVLVRTLTHANGKAIGGLAAGRRIYLTANAAARGAFHHELAHVLHHAYREHLDEAEWKTANPEAFRYGCESGVDATRRSEDRRAFVSSYAMTNIREDVAETASELFSDGYDSRFNGSRGEALEAKASLLIEFYRSIDPVFSEEYFKNLS